MAVQPPPQAPAAEDPPPDGQAESSRALTILGHLQELRSRAMWSAGALVIGQRLRLEAARFNAVGEVVRCTAGAGGFDVGVRFLTIRFEHRQGSFFSASA